MRAEIRAISPAKKQYNAPAEREQNIVGLRLLEARKVRDWTLADLCDRLRECGVETTRSSISKWETGATIPNAYQLVALCMVLGIVDEIFAVEDVDEVSAAHSTSGVSGLGFFYHAAGEHANVVGSGIECL